MKDIFVGWLLSMLTMLGAGYFCFEAGYFEYVYKADVSKLCFLILALFLYAYGRLGYLLLDTKRVNEESLNVGFEAADMSMAIGMLGTVIGFIVMSSSFASVDFSDINNIKDLFQLATTGMSTALYTTAFGLVSSILLRASHFIVYRKLGL